ncbi:DEAD/DEAH box helicase, partial [Candidatus Borrarchaeum sp.]|uniref:DEAD/DEAH box helicase n=1 Tax=Candidatus Borrarchaeum sp. TaxID=2846742 RepID=UPI00257DC1D3
MKNALPVNYISHPLLTENCIESRIYQQKILARAIHNNTIIVLPAGMGKTIIATLIIAYHLNKNVGKNGTINTQCIFLTPTKPLVLKYIVMLQEKLTIPEHINYIIGNISNDKRAKLFKKSKIVVMTPNVLYTDIINDRYDFGNVSLIVFDECHRAAGKHAYVKVADQYFLQKSKGRVLGITTSLGNKRITEEVCRNLRITSVDSRTTSDYDISSYVSQKRIEWHMIPLPKLFQDIRTVLEKQLYRFIEGLAKKSVNVPDDPRKITLKQLVELQGEYQNKLSSIPLRTKLSANLKLLIAQIASCIRLFHLIERIETQGLSSAKHFIEKIKEKALQDKKGYTKREMLRRFYRLKSIKTVEKMLEEGLREGYEHPKIIETVEIVKKQITEKPDSRILIFANYRASINIIVDELNKMNLEAKKVCAAGLVGHKHKGTIGGLSSKQQMTLLKHFKEGIINVLVATSVAEQGLDIIDSD